VNGLFSGPTPFDQAPMKNFFNAKNEATLAVSELGQKACGIPRYKENRRGPTDATGHVVYLYGVNVVSNCRFSRSMMKAQFLVKARKKKENGRLRRSAPFA
jgi:hypothetical protein